MQNFTFYNPVKIVFGKETISELTDLIDKKEKILLLYGGGSIKRNGVYDQVMEALEGRSIVEFGGIEANPEYETCLKAVKLAKKEGITFLLSVGGGSVLDATKFIACAVLYESDPWEIVTTRAANVKAALPFGDVITLPATGSEMNPNAVISREATKEKFAFSSPYTYPLFSILDPETTYTLPPRQVINGIVDAYVHVVEQYLNDDLNTPLQDRQATAILSTLIEISPKLLEEKPEYDSRATFMWSATNALNGLIACGVTQDWSTHLIGHELTALYGIDHAQSLAVVLPAVWRADKENKAAKLIQYADRVWNITGNDQEEVIEKAIESTVQYFNSIGMKTRLSDYKINAKEAALRVADRFRMRGTVLGVYKNLTPDIIQNMLEKC